jgi:hypothetical protein
MTCCGPRYTRCRAFGNDAFRAQLASFGKDRRALGLDMLAVADDLVFRQAIEHLRQDLLALGKRLLAKIVPVEVQQIEDEVGQRMGRALVEGRLQVGKAALPGPESTTTSPSRMALST